MQPLVRAVFNQSSKPTEVRVQGAPGEKRHATGITCYGPAMPQQCLELVVFPCDMNLHVATKHTYYLGFVFQIYNLWFQVSNTCGSLCNSRSVPRSQVLPLLSSTGCQDTHRGRLEKARPQVVATCTASSSCVLYLLDIGLEGNEFEGNWKVENLTSEACLPLLPTHIHFLQPTRGWKGPNIYVKCHTVRALELSLVFLFNSCNNIVKRCYFLFWNGEMHLIGDELHHRTPPQPRPLLFPLHLAHLYPL